MTTQGIINKIGIALRYLNSNSWQVGRNVTDFKLYNNKICFMPGKIPPSGPPILDTTLLQYEKIG